MPATPLNSENKLNIFYEFMSTCYHFHKYFYNRKDYNRQYPSCFVLFYSTCISFAPQNVFAFGAALPKDDTSHSTRCSVRSASEGSWGSCCSGSLRHGGSASAVSKLFGLVVMFSCFVVRLLAVLFFFVCFGSCRFCQKNIQKKTLKKQK